MSKKFGAETTVDIIKLLITLSVGFLGFSAAMAKITLDPTESFEISGAYWFLIISWVCILCTIISGILALGAIVTNAIDANKYDVDSGYVQQIQIVQQISFVVSFIFFLIFVKCS